MVEWIQDMPAGTIGLRARGTLSKADYTEVIEPALREAVKVFDDLDEVDEATRWVAG